MESLPQDHAERCFDSWKEIAAFFGRDERTVRRWEKDQALPVHRIPGAAKGRVFAYQSELEKWLKKAESARPEAAKEAAASAATAVATTPQPSEAAVPATAAEKNPRRTYSINNWAAALGLCAIALMAGLVLSKRGAHWPVQTPADPGSAASKAGVAPSPARARAEDFYLQGRYYWNKRTPDDLNRAVDEFTQAIVQDPNYAEAYVGLADSYNLLREYSAMPEDEAYPRAYAAASKAVELDGTSAEAHTSLAFVTYYWNWDAAGAEREYRAALALDPASARTHHWYATFLFSTGRVREALEQIEEARRLEPGSVAILSDKGIILHLAGQTDAAIALLKGIEAEEPAFASPHRYLAEIYFDRRQWGNYLTEWKATAERTRDKQEMEIVKAAEAGYAKGGYAGMLEATVRVESNLYERNALPAYSLALAYARLGERAQTMRYLETSFERRESGLLELPNQPAFNFIRGDKEYTELMRRVRTSPRPAANSIAVAMQPAS